jgi:hypothetical protein
VIAGVVLLAIINPLGDIEMQQTSEVDVKRSSQTIKVNRLNGQSTSVQSSSVEADSNISSPKQYLASYIDYVLPAVFRMKSGVTALLHEIHRHHRYWLIFTPSTNKWHRTKQMMHILCSWLFMCFTMALMFDLEVHTDYLTV